MDSRCNIPDYVVELLITSKTASNVVCVVEDWLRYNTFRSPSGSGVFAVGAAVCFQLNENGHPMIDPVPASITSATFYQNINSRFQYLNPQMHYVLDQTSHGFSAGDVISNIVNWLCPNNGIYSI